MFKNLINYLFRPTVHDKVYADAMNDEIEEWKKEKENKKTEDKLNKKFIKEEIQSDGSIKFYKNYLLVNIANYQKNKFQNICYSRCIFYKR